MNGCFQECRDVDQAPVVSIFCEKCDVVLGHVLHVIVIFTSPRLFSTALLLVVKTSTPVNFVK